MTAAAWPRPAWGQRLLVVHVASERIVDHRFEDLPDLLEPGDRLVVNDAFTLPASMSAEFRGQRLEIRLTGPAEDGWAVLFGPGSWRQATEVRLPPPALAPGDRLVIGDAEVPVLEVDARFARLVRLDLPAHVMWRHGRPVQYSHLRGPLALAHVQTPYAARPWATEMPSAGRPLTAGMLDRLRARDIRVLTVTHAAGLSATGDPALDEALPLPEHFAVPEATWREVIAAQRVIAVGTSVVRALESAARGPLEGVTDLRIGPGTEREVVDGLLSGMHAPEESHFALMAAFADLGLLRRAHAHAEVEGYHAHEFGDSTLVL